MSIVSARRATTTAAVISILHACLAPAMAQSDADGPVAPAAGRTIAPLGQPPEGTKFQPVTELKQEGGVNPATTGRYQPAKTADWPATFYATFQTNDGLSMCTAALVGPQAVLTAAHCTAENGPFRFTFRDKEYDAECTRHKDYAADLSADFALCRVEKPVQAPAGFRYETIDAAHGFDSYVAKGGVKPVLTIAGYGCTSDVVGSLPSISYNVGTNYAISSSLSKIPANPYPALYAPAQNNNLFTAEGAAVANICPGDSGGAVYVVNGKSRAIVGVNSRVFVVPGTPPRYGSSILSATGSPDFYNWAHNWAKKTAKVEVCGILVESIACHA